MQLYPILLVAIVLAADGGLRLAAPGTDRASAVMAVAFAWGAPAILLLGTWIGVIVCRRRIDATGSTRLILAAERLVRMARWLLLAIHAAAVLVLGWLDAVRLAVGNLILIDELITLLPPVLGLLGTWWVIYPIERRLREALLIRRLDLGQPVHPMPSRARFVFAQTRVGLLLMLVPILLIVAMSELIHNVGERWLGWSPTSGVMEAATFIAAISVFIFAPLLARFVLSVRSMPDGFLRDELLNICRRHGVQVRDILFWDTSNSMINAAVMGLVGRLRYVLVTDALLETMDLEQLRAVMAHEVGHVRRHHMPWLVLVLFAVIVASVMVIELPLIALYFLGWSPTHWTADWVTAAVTLIQLGVALLAFGWISRRFERQADTFAVQHLSGLGLPPDRSVHQSEDVRIQPEAAGAMQRALGTIAELNAIDPDRPSWRHGSIRWRQMYLASIIGRPALALPIDRQVRRIKLVAAVVLAIGLAGWLLLYATAPAEIAAAGAVDASPALAATKRRDVAGQPPCDRWPRVRAPLTRRASSTIMQAESPENPSSRSASQRRAPLVGPKGSVAALRSPLTESKAREVMCLRQEHRAFRLGRATRRPRMCCSDHVNPPSLAMTGSGPSSRTPGRCGSGPQPRDTHTVSTGLA